MTAIIKLEVEDLITPEGIEQARDKIREALQSDPEAKLAGLAWPLVRDRLAKALNDTLEQLDIFSLLAQAWCKARELREFADTQKYPPPSKNALKLGKHVIALPVHPVIRLVIGAWVSKPIRFTIDLEAEFEAITLIICDGSIATMQAGTLDLRATLKYKDIALHSPTKLKHLAFVKAYPFKPPLKIPWAKQGRPV